MYSFRLTEEIARWAFEVVCKQNDEWYIAFTNPTAGPWKTIKGLNKSGQEGEVFRFELEETRPDILLVNDKMKIIIIIEAKDSLDKLVSGNQAKKSAEVVVQLAKILATFDRNQFWGERAHYSVITGLLWGAENRTSQNEREYVFDTYHDWLPNDSGINTSFIMGIETCRQGTGLECRICGKAFEKGASKLLTPLAESLRLQIL